MTIYEQMVEAGVETDSHESDLYVLSCEASRRILALAPAEIRKTARVFVSEKDGRTWIDIPFAYDPFWKQRAPR